MKTLCIALVSGGFGAALWSSPIIADQPSAMPGDDAMTCEKIAEELAPYARQMTPNATARNETNMELKRRGEKHMAEEAPVIAAETEAAAAASVSGVPGVGAAASAAAQTHQEAMHQRDVA